MDFFPLIFAFRRKQIWNQLNLLNTRFISFFLTMFGIILNEFSCICRSGILIFLERIFVGFIGFIYFETKIFVTVLNSNIFSHFILMESFKNYSIKAILGINSKRNSKSLLNIIRHLIIIQILQFVRKWKTIRFFIFVWFEN